MKRLILMLSAICIGCQSVSEYAKVESCVEMSFEKIGSKSKEGKNLKNGQVCRAENRDFAQNFTAKSLSNEEIINFVDFFVFNSEKKLENITLFSPNIYISKIVPINGAEDKTIYSIANADSNVNIETLPDNSCLTAATTATTTTTATATAIKYTEVKQKRKPLIYFIQESIKQQLAEHLEVAGGATSGILSVEFSAYVTPAPCAMDLVESITNSDVNLVAKTPDYHVRHIFHITKLSWEYNTLLSNTNKLYQKNSG